MRKLLLVILISLPVVGFLYFFQPCFTKICSVKNSSPAFVRRLVKAAKNYTNKKVKYRSSYKVIAYPLGDVPLSEGVCTDLVIRAYRQLGIDLQKLVHEDMQQHFNEYPQRWDLKKPDSSIDHRRVANLAVFFKRNGQTLPITDNPCDYRAGDIVVWDTSIGDKKLDHIGIVSDKKVFWCSQRPKVLHHPFGYPREDDALFYGKIIGHYQYYGVKK